MNYSDDMKRRLRRIEGQIGGVLRMMEEEKTCKEVVSQLSAIRSATDRVIAYIVSRNLEQCIKEELAKTKAKKVTRKSWSMKRWLSWLKADKRVQRLKENLIFVKKAKQAHERMPAWFFNGF
jgi:DNA-binding FrmR family transcriptional regulator